MSDSTLTERGQVSLPASLRKEMGLKPGQRLKWEKISDRELRVTLEPETVKGPMAMLGYGRKLGIPYKSTDEWMKELRAGDE